MSIRFKIGIITLLSILLINVKFNLAADRIVMATGEWAPYTSEKADNYGLFVEIVSAVTKEMGRTPIYKFYPWKRCENQVQLGKAWAAFPYARTEEREKMFAFSRDVISAKSVFFYYKNRMKAVTWEKLEDLRPYRIGGVLGYFYKKEFEDAKLNVQYSTKEIMNIEKLIKGRIDLCPLNEPVGWEMIKSNYPDEMKNFAILKKAHQRSPLHIMVLKTNPESMRMLEQFDTALQKIKTTGIYEQILRHYNMSP